MLLKELGYPVFSADEVVRELTAPGGKAHQRVKALCPRAVRPDGTLDRRLILERLVRDPEFRKKLETLLHPLVREELEAFFQKNRNREIVFAEIPLLFEAGWEELFDEIWVVACGEEEQRRRLCARLGEVELVEALMKLSWPLSEKIRRAHRVFSSEKSPEALRDELQEVLSKMRAPVAERA